ncbi:MAG: hypothetical protein AABW41_01775 [Nanoarchaeota archaeon]
MDVSFRDKMILHEINHEEYLKVVDYICNTEGLLFGSYEGKPLIIESNRVYGPPMCYQIVRIGIASLEISLFKAASETEKRHYRANKRIINEAVSGLVKILFSTETNKNINEAI